MSDTRALFRAAAASGTTITHPAARFHAGVLMCAVCSVRVGADVAWAPHISSAPHKAAVARLALSHNASAAAAPTVPSATVPTNSCSLVAGVGDAGGAGADAPNLFAPLHATEAASDTERAISEFLGTIAAEEEKGDAELEAIYSGRADSTDAQSAMYKARAAILRALATEGRLAGARSDDESDDDDAGGDGAGVLVSHGAGSGTGAGNTGADKELRESFLPKSEASTLTTSEIVQISRDRIAKRKRSSSESDDEEDDLVAWQRKRV